MEENKDALGEDMDIENLASVLSDTGEGGEGKEAVPETPVFSEEPAVSSGEQGQDPAVPPASSAQDVPPPPDAAVSSDQAEGAPVSGQDSASDGEPSKSEEGDIDALIKKYEEIPAGKKEIVKKDIAGGKGKSLPIVPIAAAAGVIIVLALLKFVVFKPAPAVKKIQPKQAVAKAAAAKSGSAAPGTAERPPAGAISAGFDYPGGTVLLGETKDGIETRVFETAAAARDIKLFYQKKMSEKGFELSTSKKRSRTFNMNFFKGLADYSVSVVPHAGKNLIIVTHAK
ncbi:MAG: hypothetical protein U9O97_02255 [Elusimicrobiota bacterium]|nr:hypothetical protein [Elusimicrobiota bacterium]